jgi:hypothetical protein
MPARIKRSRKMKSFLSRRTFLRGSGAMMALPMLDAMVPIGGAARAAAAAARPPRRMVAVCSTLGFHTPFLFPDQPGKIEPTTPYLNILKPVIGDVSVFSGLSHPAVDGGHSAEYSFLTAAPHPGAPNFKNTISLDQFAAERIGAETRFPFLALSGTGVASISWTRSGVRIPGDGKPSKVFERLFLGGPGGSRKLKDGKSVMDLVGEQAKQMQREVGVADRQKLDEYFTSVRELEQRLVRGQEWAKTPKPKVDVPPPKDITDQADMIGQIKLMYDLMHLAIKTDSTRLITFLVNAGGGAVLKIPGVDQDWHNLSHHGQDPKKLERLKLIEAVEFEGLRDFLLKLKATQEQDETLLDRTMVLFGSHLGNSSSHSTKNLPMLLAGGGFRHGNHLAFDKQNNTPACNLYVSVLQRLGIETGSFASGTTTLTGLEARARRSRLGYCQKAKTRRSTTCESFSLIATEISCACTDSTNAAAVAA